MYTAHVMDLGGLPDHELMLLVKAYRDPSAAPGRSPDDSEPAAVAEAAFAELIRRHQGPLLNYFRRMGAHMDEAEDLVQETFLRVFGYRSRYEPVSKFTSFLYVLARHARADALRRAARSPEPRTDAVESAQGASPGSRGSHLDVQAALDRLSETLRPAVVLSVFQGLSYQEIADVLGIPLGTVKSRIHAGMKQLREMLDD